ncbi:MAG: hypothetical protein Kow00124_10530 [Anaerolineae bacterium]
MNDENISINRDLLRWVLLALGVLGLIVMLVALVVTPGNRFGTVSYIAAGVAVLGIAGFILIDPQAIVTALSGPTHQYALATWGMSLVFVALIGVAYVVIRQANLKPIDLTEAQRYTLSEESINLLKTLEEPVHATAFYTEGQSSQAEEARIWLDQYVRYSDGKFTYDVVDPERSPQEAQRLGITRAGVIVLEQGDRTAEASFASERDLTGALVQVLIGEVRKVYFTTGHGERDFEDFASSGYATIRSQLVRLNFEVEPHSLLREGAVPEDADLLIIAGPTSQFTQPEVDLIREYVNRGGSLMVLSDPGAGSGGVLDSGVLGLAFSPDGTRLATAAANGAITIWDVNSGRQLQTLLGHTRDVIDVAYSSDGARLVSASTDGTVRLWDAETGEQIATLEGQTQLVSRVAFSPEGDLIASVGEDQLLNVWDAETLQPLSYSPITATVPLIAITFSPDGSLIAAGGGRSSGAGGFALAWDSRTGDQVLLQALHENLVFDVAFSPDGATLYTAAVDGTLGTIDVATGAGSVEPLFPEVGLTAIDVTADGTLIYGVGDGTVRIGSGPEQITIQAHEDLIWDLGVAPDGQSVASASRDGQARRWSLADGELIREYAAGAAVDPLLAYLESDWGVLVRNDIVVDLDTANQFSLDTPVIFTTDPVSPVTQNLNLLTFFQVARSVETVTEIDGITTRGLLFTTPNEGRSWGETNRFGVAELDAEDTPGPVKIALSAENANTGSRLIVVGDADFVSNNALQYASFGNDRFFINAANWLTESEEAINLPSTDVGLRTLDRPFTPVSLGLVIVTSVCLIPATAAAGGVLLWVSRRRRR